MSRKVHIRAKTAKKQRTLERIVVELFALIYLAVKTESGRRGPTRHSACADCQPCSRAARRSQGRRKKDYIQQDSLRELPGKEDTDLLFRLSTRLRGSPQTIWERTLPSSRNYPLSPEVYVRNATKIRKDTDSLARRSAVGTGRASTLLPQRC